MFEFIANCDVYDSPLNPSTHLPVRLQIQCTIDTISCTTNVTDDTSRCCIEWSKVTSSHVNAYHNELDSSISSIDISPLLCRDVFCSN
jgi:hypothetical protein